MASWIQADVSSGKMSEAQARTSLADLGREFTPPVADTRSAEEKMVDKAFSGAKPEEFVIDYGLPDGERMSQEMQSFDASARSWLANSGMHRELGNSFVHTIDSTLRETAKMSDAELETYGQREFQKLEHVYKDKLEDRLRLGARMVAELEKIKPGLKQLLQSQGSGDNAMVASLIVQQAERYFARRKP